MPDAELSAQYSASLFGGAMPKLFDLRKGRAIGDISGEDLAFLRSKLELEKPTDVDYFLTRDTLEGLKGAEAQPSRHLYQLLSVAIGPDQELDIGVSDSSPEKPFKVNGRITDKGRPCACCKVEAYDEHPVADAWLGAAFTEADGSFLLGFNDRDFRADAALLILVTRWENGNYRELLRLKPRATQGKELNLGDVDISD